MRTPHPTNRALVSGAIGVDNEPPFRRGPDPEAIPDDQPAGGFGAGRVIEQQDPGDEHDQPEG